MTCAFEDPEAAVGLIFGTGTNACYIEQLSKAEMWSMEEGEEERSKLTPENRGILNCEWGAFGNGGCLDEIGEVQVSREETILRTVIGFVSVGANFTRIPISSHLQRKDWDLQVSERKSTWS